MTVGQCCGGDSHVSSIGTNTGASMLIQRHLPPASHCCCVSIYVNNNIQGVTNSVLLGSKVSMGDAGVRLSLRESTQSSKDDDGLRVEMKKLVVMTRMLLLILSSGLLLGLIFLLWKHKL
ncbi:hypothetical protein Cni_G14524 [Canna indica]|uniref:Uncharacterized protein n=1 Tax=Canna indica TaxID=4628 RepID=A0AAQ3KBM4_9LILI|nr:hypothetical protein Cni_G14524 [Canna indica]